MGAGNSRAAKGGEAFEIDEEEEEHRGCCGCFAKGVCSAFIALAMLASTGLSAAAILRSKDDYWVLYDSKGATPAYRVQTGWYTYHVGGDNATAVSLQELSFVLWIMGLVSVGALGVSFLLSVLYMAITLFGNAGRHIRFVAIPSALLLGGILAAFYLIAALAIRDLATAAVQQPYLAWPNYGWCFGMGSALLWLLTGLFSCCMPSKRVVQYVKQQSPRAAAGANSVYRVRSTSASSLAAQQPCKADGESVEPLSKTGALSVDSAGDQGLGAAPPKRSWFGRKPRLIKPSAREMHRMHADDIAQRYGDKNV